MCSFVNELGKTLFHLSLNGLVLRLISLLVVSS